jgi:two-component system, OmpR family, response regulator VanR
MNNNFLLFKDKSILFAEDDMISRAQIVDILSMLFDKVYPAVDGLEAYRVYEDEKPDIILTDIKMPKKDGLSLVRKIREQDYKTPIILMTSFAEQELLVEAANLSVDGYLVKPASLEKLNSALRKALQRIQGEVDLIYLNETYYYSFATKELYNNDAIVPLGSKERDLLVLFLKNRDKTITKEDIDSELWPLEMVSNSAMKKLVLRLRQKIDDNIIVSVRGIGYRLETRKTPR